MKNKRDIDAFQAQLQNALAEEGLLPRVTRLKDTIYPDTDNAMTKFIVELHGNKIEVLLHTYQSYINYYNQDIFSHEEYVIRRFYRGEVIQRLFPTDIYPTISHEDAEDILIGQVRGSMRSQ